MLTDLAIFDLDNTLIAGDSDYAWGEFLVEKGVVDKVYYAEKNAEFYDDYKQGSLNIDQFLRFSLQPLANNSLEDLCQWRDEFVDTIIEPMMLPAAEQLITRHKDSGHKLLIITATNTFVTAPIATRLGIENLIGTNPELVDNKYTGAVSGIPSFQDGKVTRLENWLNEQEIEIKNSWFYSDSHNDIPLLSIVDKPVVVDPDDKLLTYAQSKSWDIISLRTETILNYAV